MKAIIYQEVECPNCKKEFDSGVDIALFLGGTMGFVLATVLAIFGWIL